MDRIIILTIVNNKRSEKPIHILYAPIQCSPNEEESIKILIESKQIDLSALIEIMMPDVAKKMTDVAKTALEEFQKTIEGANIIIVTFLEASEMERIKESCAKNAMLYATSKN